MNDVATPPTKNAAERAQDMRDLRRQILQMEGADERDVIVTDVGPKRRMTRIYSMVDGEPLNIPLTILERTLAKMDDTGKYLFTAKKEEAPEYKRGEIKCFLHQDSPDQTILREIGLGGLSCPAAHLANQYSKRIHALHRHKNQWQAYQEYLEKENLEEYRSQQRQQIEATLKLAEAATKRGPGRPPKEQAE